MHYKQHLQWMSEYAEDCAETHGLLEEICFHISGS